MWCQKPTFIANRLSKVYEIVQTQVTNYNEICFKYCPFFSYFSRYPFPNIDVGTRGRLSLPHPPGQISGGLIICTTKFEQILGYINDIIWMKIWESCAQMPFNLWLLPKLLSSSLARKYEIIHFVYAATEWHFVRTFLYSHIYVCIARSPTCDRSLVAFLWRRPLYGCFS